MNPTLKAGDGLELIPYNGRMIRSGDVIVFTLPGAPREVVHRVTSVKSKKIETRGDGNLDDDPWSLTRDNVIGRVAYARRGNRRIRIYGGLIGRLNAATAKVRRLLDLRISALLRPLYRRWAVGSIPTFMKKRVLAFNRLDGTELQLLIGNHVIGRRPPGWSRWQIRRPFRLFVNEASLPQGHTGQRTSPS